MKVNEAYENLERIITYGFLSVRMSFGGHDLLIKNITDKEYRQLEMLCSSGNVRKSSLYSIAYCTAFIDGVNFLDKRDDYFNPLVSFYENTPALFLSKIVDAINELNNSFSESIDFLEGFSYSDRSRYLWRILDLYNRSSYLGIKGIDITGLNSVQENWISINKRLDDEDKYSRDLNLTLLVVGASNPKSAKIISKNYEFHNQELSELRKEISKYGYDRKRVEHNDEKREAWTAPLNSREDLVRELYRQMSGEKDKHDFFIDEWVAQQKNKAELAKKNVEEKQNSFKEKIKDIDLSLVEASKPISAEELNRILENKKNNRSNNTYIEGSDNNEKKERVLRKLSATIIRPEIKGK